MKLECLAMNKKCLAANLLTGYLLPNRLFIINSMHILGVVKKKYLGP